MRVIELGEETRSILSNALRSAALHYAALEEEWKTDALAGVRSMAAQWGKQSDEARALADDVDNAGRIMFEQSNAVDAVPFRFVGKSSGDSARRV